MVGATSDVDVRTTKTAYDGQSNLGWTLRQPTSVTVDAVTGGLNLRITTLYDAATGVTMRPACPEVPPAATPTPPRRSTTPPVPTRPTAPAAPSRSSPACKTLPAAQPGTSGLPDLPVTQTSYDRYNQPATVTETVGSTTRTTTTTYDTAGRATDVAVTSTVGTALPSVHTGYDPNKRSGDHHPDHRGRGHLHHHP